MKVKMGIHLDETEADAVLDFILSLKTWLEDRDLPYDMEITAGSHFHLGLTGPSEEAES